MGLFLSTGGSPFTITELGYTIPASTTDWNIAAQFTAEEIKAAASLTAAIQAGTITWRKVAAGTVQTAADYDPDYTRVTDELAAGAGGSIDATVAVPFLTTAFCTLGSVQATANSIKTLTRLSNTQQVFTGTVAGQRLRMPVATTLINTHIYEVWNFSTQNLELQDAGGNVLTTLKPNSRTTVILQNNSTSNGVWQLTYTLDNGNVFGTQLYYQEANSETSTNSQVTYLNKVTLTTPTLPLGDYLIQYQFNWRTQNANRNIDFRVQRGGSDVDTGAPFSANVNDRPLLSGFKRVQSISGAQTVTLDFRVGAANSTTVYMSNARLFVWRVA